MLYGPPGTGKSYLAKACANEADCTFFSISPSVLFSSWQGESEKLVRQLFKQARENKPSIIFIDEIDSILGQRREGENDSSRRVKNEFLGEMDGVGKNNDGVLVLGATNLPWEIDPAARRRFTKRIFIPLPNEYARTCIFKSSVGATPHSLTEEDFELLGEQTEGYSGSDIATVVKCALLKPLRKCYKAKKFIRTANGKYKPTTKNDKEGVEINISTF